MKLIKTACLSFYLCAISTVYGHATAYDCEAPRTCSSSSDNSLFVDAEYLYWKPSQAGMTYALAISEASAATIGAYNKALQQKSDWGSGYRLGVGVDIASSSTDATFIWTHFQHSADTSSNDPLMIGTQILGPSTPSTLGGSSIGDSSADSTWRLKLNVLEFDLSYDFFNNECYHLRPYLGVAAAHLRQTQKINYNQFLDTNNAASLDATIKQTNNFRGTGPKLGLQGGVEITSGFELMGNFAASFFYGQSKNPYKVHFENDPVGFPLADYEVNYEKHRIIPALQGQAGVAYTLESNCFSVTLSLLYEVQYFVGVWRNQNSQSQNLYTPDAGYQDLTLQGFTGQLKVSF